MADPLSIVGGVAAILDLISFGYKIVSVAAELRDSAGELEVNSEQDVVVQDIEAILGNLRPSDGAEPNAIEPLRQKALIIATQLKTALAKLKIGDNHSTWKAIRVAIRNVWDKKKVEELDYRLRGLSLELNTSLTANSSRLLEQTSAEQRARFDAVLTSIGATQTRMAELFRQQNDSFSSTLEMQSLKIRESSRNDSQILQSNITAQLELLNDASSDVARKNNEIEDKLDRMGETDEQLRAILESIMTSGRGIQEQLNCVETLVKKSSGLDEDLRGKKLVRAENHLRKGYDIFAQYIFQMSKATFMEEAHSEGKNASAITTMGHTYSGTSLVTEDAVHIQGNLGRPEQDTDGGCKNLYSGKTTASGKGTVISGNVTDPEFLPWNRKA